MDIGMRGVRPKRTTSPAEDRICLAYFWFSASFLNARSKIVSASNRDFRVGVLWEYVARVPKRTLFRKSGLAGSPHPNSRDILAKEAGVLLGMDPPVVISFEDGFWTLAIGIKANRVDPCHHRETTSTGQVFRPLWRLLQSRQWSNDTGKQQPASIPAQFDR